MEKDPRNFTLNKLVKVHEKALKKYGDCVNLIFDAGVPYLEAKIDDKTSQRKVAEFDWIDC